jgi:hypothetical protein
MAPVYADWWDLSHRWTSVTVLNRFKTTCLQRIGYRVASR